MPGLDLRGSGWWGPQRTVKAGKNEWWVSLKGTGFSPYIKGVEINGLQPLRDGLSQTGPLRKNGHGK